LQFYWTRLVAMLNVTRGNFGPGQSSVDASTTIVPGVRLACTIT
jgi:hypothetical protein